MNIDEYVKIMTAIMATTGAVLSVVFLGIMAWIIIRSVLQGRNNEQD